MKINKDIELTEEEKVSIVKDVIKEKPNLVKELLIAKENGYAYLNCCWGTKCNYYPCTREICSADTLDNGIPYKWS